MRPDETILSAVAQLDVEHNHRYQRRDVTGDDVPETFCNTYVADFLDLMRCPLPGGMLAREQIEWMGGPVGAAAGWLPCDGALASVVAELGQPTIATWLNPNGHSHVAVVVPGATPGIHVAQAGAVNFSCKPIASGFGSKKPIKFWTHPPATKE